MNKGNQVFLVAGGASGIGLAVSEQLAESTANVVLIGRNPEKLRFQESRLHHLYPSAHVSVILIDLTKERSDEALRTELRRMEPQLAGAVFSIGSGRPLLGSRVSRLAESLQLNLLSAARFVEGSIEFAKDDGSFVFVSSIAGHEKIEAPAEYAASKSALEVMVKNWAEEFAPVRINVVSPGNVRTADSVWEERSKLAPDELCKFLDSTVPLGRLGEPNEIAEAIVFLLSEKGAFITGTTLTVDGGQKRSYR